jgi:hypothetical protein
VAGFVVPDMKALLAYADVVRKQTLDYVAAVKPGELDREVSCPRWARSNGRLLLLEIYS